MKMNMKKIISWGMMLAAAFTLTNCAKEMDAPVQEPESNGYPFEIVASTVDTKTVNDGMSTKWAEGDKLNVFHALGDDPNYVNDGAFTVSDVEAGVFTGTIAEELDVEEEYDWFALYPYSEQVTTPAATSAGYTYIGHSKGLNQTGYDSMASLKGSVCPLYGVLKYGGVKPELEMQHLSSVIAINVTNDTDEPLTITTASFTAPEAIVGSFYINFTDKDNVVYTASEGYSLNTAVVNVTEGTALEKGESAVLYLAIKPFTAAAGKKLTLAVNRYSKEITLAKDAVFTAGKIKTVNFSYDTTEAPAGPSTISVAEFLNLKDTATEYVLTGEITRVVNTSYGNFDLTDATGTVYVYGLLTPEGASQKQWAAAGLKMGDVITVRGKYSVYNNSPQIKNAYYVSHLVAFAEPQINCVDNVVTLTAEEGATIYYTIDGSDPTVDSFEYVEPFEIEETITVKAIAAADGRPSSPIASKICAFVDPNGSGDGPGTPSTTACYTLSTASKQGSNSAYAGACDITVDGIKWNVAGNTQINPWRFGGKSITKVDRAIYTKTAYPAPLSKVEFVSGTLTATWNSLTLVYSTNSDFSNAQTMSAPSVGASKTIEFVPEGGFPANCYFKFILNITNTATSSNKYVQMKEIKFYGYDN